VKEASMRIVGALLAGGQSRRMGRAKAGVVVDGETLAARALALLAEVAPAVVVVGHGDDVPRSAHIGRIDDTRPGAGPLAALEALLASDRGDVYVVLPVDMPRLTATTLRRVLAALHDDADIAVLAGPNGYEHLPFAMRARALPLVRGLLHEGERSLHALLARAAVATVARGDDDAARDELANVNTPDDVARLRH
jgi:molybdopterin-guanine dinucleotide biosynthesis protein A